ncbi:hypothetical protein FA15DRAFT_702886 [Coprinopsis marcescibilis]|uniref:NYN domain-containing protein n=1 Tax=Coprinopsis marcescibilis TaxID=230819 RepID=A0A5C3LDE0_COPMA|nr:hypothetical protein FA15DRAFT_702886 [Coprinopsis marcescibilis]
MSEHKHVSVYWDMSALPREEVTGFEFARSIRTLVAQLGVVRTFNFYIDSQSPLMITANQRSELQCSGVAIVDTVSNGRTNACSKMMISDCLVEIIDGVAADTFLFITGDSDTLYTISLLRARGYKTVVLCPGGADRNLTATATWTDLNHALFRRATSKDEPTGKHPYMASSPVQLSFSGASTPVGVPFTTADVDRTGRLESEIGPSSKEPPGPGEEAADNPVTPDQSQHLLVDKSNPSSPYKANSLPIANAPSPPPFAANHDGNFSAPSPIKVPMVLHADPTAKVVTPVNPTARLPSSAWSSLLSDAQTPPKPVESPPKIKVSEVISPEPSSTSKAKPSQCVPSAGTKEVVSYESFMKSYEFPKPAGDQPVSTRTQKQSADTDLVDWSLRSGWQAPKANAPLSVAAPTFRPKPKSDLMKQLKFRVLVECLRSTPTNNIARGALDGALRKVDPKFYENSGLNAIEQPIVHLIDTAYEAGIITASSGSQVTLSSNFR